MTMCIALVEPLAGKMAKAAGRSRCRFESTYHCASAGHALVFFEYWHKVTFRTTCLNERVEGWAGRGEGTWYC